MHLEFFAQFKRVTLKQINSRKEEWLAEVMISFLLFPIYLLKCDEGLSVNVSTVRLLLHGMRFSFIKLQCRTNIYLNEYYCRLQANFLRYDQYSLQKNSTLSAYVLEQCKRSGRRATTSYGVSMKHGFIRECAPVLGGRTLMQWTHHLLLSRTD